MQDWYKYWHVKPKAEDHAFTQVGKTVNRQPISQQQFKVIVQDIRDRLELRATDTVLDLCCGNGVITYQVGKYCKQILAIDFSRPLLDVAEHEFQSANIQYILGDVCALPDSIINAPITKAYIYEALQHLSLKQTEQLFEQLANLPVPLSKFLLGAIPDSKRIWNFYNTAKRREEYMRRCENGTEAIGHWWNREELEDLANDFGFKVQFIEQSASQHGSHYRFDMICLPKTKKTL